MKSLSNIGAGAPGSQEWVVLHAQTPDRMGDELKQMFGALTAGPMPDRMLQLTEALEEAFRRGDLFDGDPRRIS
jgi:hypothetical protein